MEIKCFPQQDLYRIKPPSLTLGWGTGDAAFPPPLSGPYVKKEFEKLLVSPLMRAGRYALLGIPGSGLQDRRRDLFKMDLYDLR